MTDPAPEAPASADLFRTARHECGHALAVVLTHHKFRYVTLRPRGGYQGLTTGINARYAFGDAVITWAGLMAGREDELQTDTEHLAELSIEYPTLDMERAVEKAMDIVTDYADALDFLAARLVERKTLTQRQFLEALAEWTTQTKAALAAAQ